MIAWKIFLVVHALRQSTQLRMSAYIVGNRKAPVMCKFCLLFLGGIVNNTLFLNIIITFRQNIE